MKSYSLTFLSKSKNSLHNSFLFFKKILVLHFNILKKYLKKRKKIKKLTLLKSPHVNKTAQEQFEIRTFFRKLNIYSPKNLKYLIFLKTIKTDMFSNVFFKINFFLNKKNNNLILSIINPDNFKINNNFYVSQKICKKVKNLQFENLEELKNKFKIIIGPVVIAFYKDEYFRVELTNSLFEKSMDYFFLFFKNFLKSVFYYWKIIKIQNNIQNNILCRRKISSEMKIFDVHGEIK